MYEINVVERKYKGAERGNTPVKYLNIELGLISSAAN